MEPTPTPTTSTTTPGTSPTRPSRLCPIPPTRARRSAPRSTTCSTGWTMRPQGPTSGARCGRRPTTPYAGYRFPPEVITLAVRWYLRFGLSYRDVEELLAERGIEVDHVTVYRWV